jgi:hypothetical protein
MNPPNKWSISNSVARVVSGRRIIRSWNAVYKLQGFADPNHFKADLDPDSGFSLYMRIRIRILLLIKVMRICDHWSTSDPLWTPFVSLDTFIVRVRTLDPIK